MAETEFKVGDRVIALGETSGVATQPGDLGTVIEVDFDSIHIRWDVACSLGGWPLDKEKHDWWAFSDEIAIAGKE